MVLSNGFFYERIQIDTINERFNKVPTAKEGDANGRGMIVVLTENGLVKNTTGVTLLFKWEHTRIAGAQGLEDFEPLDLTKGEYIVTYPTEMNHEGYVKAEIRIIDNGKYAGSRNMKIQVEPSVGDDTAMESSNQFSALVTALLQVNSWNTTIDGKIVEWEADMEATKKLYIDTMNDVEETYPQELLSLGSQLSEAKADLQAGIGAVTADAEVVTARASSIKGKTFGVIDARFEDVEFDTVLMATNRVVNGDFAGLTGWSAIYAALSAANNVLSITGDGKNATPRVYQITTGKITANTKIYASQIVKVTNAVCSNITIELKSDPTLSAFGVFGSVTSPAQNVAYRVSGIFQAPSGYDNNNIVLFVRNTYADGATASGKVLQLSVPIVLNLTEIFGIGNEPTTAQMDRLLTQFPNSWFTGTKNLFLAKWALNELRRLDNAKANKAQEAWITPTLVNGATGTFQYRKNELGRLEFKGELKQASTASYFCITIAGYRPPAWIRCPITSIDGVVSMLIMSDGGALYLHTPLAGKIISFSGISINIQ